MEAIAISGSLCHILGIRTGIGHDKELQIRSDRADRLWNPVYRQPSHDVSCCALNRFNADLFKRMRTHA